MEKSTYDWIKLVVENLSLWPLLAIVVLVWLSRQKEMLQRLTKVSFGGFEFQLEALKEAVAESKLEIKALENELERERSIFNEALKGFDPNAPVSDLSETREIIRANARALENLEILEEMLAPGASAEHIFAAATTLRERRPTQYFSALVDCLDRLANSPTLGGIRLNTVWTLTSALHRILIAAIRDNIKPPISTADLEKAEKMLSKLEYNPRVLLDRPDDPDKGVRGPIRLSRKWIQKGLAPSPR